MEVEFDFGGDVVLVTGGAGTLGSAVVRAFEASGAAVAVVDVMAPDDDGTDLEQRGSYSYHRADLTDESAVATAVTDVVDTHGGLDVLCNIAGSWRGGDPLHETDLETFEFLVDVNLKTMFLATKHALPHLRATEGAIVSVSSRSSLEGGSGDGPYRATKAGIRLLTESVAKENLGTVRANAVMPSVIDTTNNREMMPDADHDSWVDPDEIADVIRFLCSDAATVTSGAAVPVYGEA